MGDGLQYLFAVGLALLGAVNTAEPDTSGVLLGICELNDTLVLVFRFGTRPVLSVGNII